ncbi:acyl-CoA dehydrogenase, C-terminal domain protein [Mycobacterium xenopi 3993]|nr:acyl-CoA dehydrogenase, C-terminal domain protein [Mycobacterium xenopi 3993]
MPRWSTSQHSANQSSSSRPTRHTDGLGGRPVRHAAALAARRHRLDLGRAMVLSAAYLTGLAAAAAQAATEHAKIRVQFGKPIGVNQAIKHRCVDMAVAAEAAQAQSFFAAIALDSGRADALLQVLSAVIVAGKAAVDNAAAGIQVFGGIGYTFENDMHLYLKRAHVLRHLFVEPAEALAQLLAQERAQ